MYTDVYIYAYTIHYPCLEMSIGHVYTVLSFSETLGNEFIGGELNYII